MQDENEGPVTKSIRLTASLILRNLVNYTTTAKRYLVFLSNCANHSVCWFTYVLFSSRFTCRCLRFYEPHLSAIALSNVESSRTIAQVLYEMNETRPYWDGHNIFHTEKTHCSQPEKKRKSIGDIKLISVFFFFYFSKKYASFSSFWRFQKSVLRLFLFVVSYNNEKQRMKAKNLVVF